jgi:hypothetical protein
MKIKLWSPQCVASFVEPTTACHNIETFENSVYGDSHILVLATMWSFQTNRQKEHRQHKYGSQFCKRA